jgi:cytochrome c biogenesis protein CcdA
MKKIIKILIPLLLIIPLFLSSTFVNGQESRKFAVSFTGIGCPHCAQVSPQLHNRVENGNLILIEYEIYSNVANSQAFSTYAQSFNLDLGIPQVLFNKDMKGVGDAPIIENIDSMIKKAVANEIPLADGRVISFEDFNLNSLVRYPTIYSKDRVAIRKSITQLNEEENEQIKTFIYSSSINDAVSSLKGSSTKAEIVKTPGGNFTYDRAVKLNGWLLQWNGDAIPVVENTEETKTNDEEIVKDQEKLSIGKIISLGLADSVNPCALSILALVLISIITYNPGKRKDILFAGLSFILAVIIMYLLYGVLIIKAFQAVQSITAIREFLFNKIGINLILGIFASIFGVLEIKDFISYKPGSIGTEMPLSLRPKVSKIIAKVTSPLAAFGVGLFVTLFLLPCTIGPYIILGGLLSSGSLINAVPSLLLYNLIFILPMLAVVLAVYFGTKKIEDVTNWKDKNVRYMHLVAGILLLSIGLLMIFGKF